MTPTYFPSEEREVVHLAAAWSDWAAAGVARPIATTEAAAHRVAARRVRVIMLVLPFARGDFPSAGIRQQFLIQWTQYQGASGSCEKAPASCHFETPLSSRKFATVPLDWLLIHDPFCSHGMRKL